MSNAGRCYAALCCASLALAGASSHAAPFAYITNKGSADVSVIDTASNTVIATVPVGSQPWGVAVNPVRRRVYVANYGSNTVSVIDTATQTVVATVPVEAGPIGVAVRPDGTRAYVTNSMSGSISVIDADTNTVIATIPATPGSTPRGIATSPDGQFAYVANDNTNDISSVILAANALGPNSAPFGLQPFDVGISLDGTSVYVTMSGECNVAVVSGAGTTSVPPIPAPGVCGVPTLGVAVNPADGDAYVAIGVGIKVIRGTTVIGTVSGGAPVGVGWHPDGTRLYAVNGGLNTVSVFDAGTLVATVPVGTNPSGIGKFVSPITAPLAPIIGSATPGNGQATIAFAPASDGGSTITSYTATCNPGPFTASGPASPLTLTGLANGTAYACSVTATNAIGTSDASASVNVTPAIAPSAPTGATATAGDAQATVTFVVPVSNGGSPITGYTVTSNPPGGVDNDAGTTGTSHVITGLTNGTAYTFTVTATNAVGTSSASAPSNSVTPAGPPSAPTGAAATAGNAQATVTFAAPASNGGSPITGYTVTSNPPGGVDSNAGMTSTNHVVTGLSNGTVYTFTVTATNAIGTSTPSTASNSVTPAGLPGAPTIGVATPGNGQATISFTPPVSNGGSAILSYTATCNPGAISASGPASSITVAGLTNGTQYTCSVTATNSVGTGPAPATTTVTPSHNTFSGPSATGSGAATVSFTGGGAACTFAPAGNGPLQSAFFIPVSGHPKSPPAGSAPGAVAFPHGLLDFVLLNCTPGSTVDFTVTYPAALPAGVQYWKYGPTPTSATPHWYVLPSTIAGNSVTFSIVDGGLGDDDLAANGSVVDQGGPGGPGPGAGIEQVPTLSEWALMLLASLMLLGAMRRKAPAPAPRPARFTADS